MFTVLTVVLQLNSFKKRHIALPIVWQYRIVIRIISPDSCQYTLFFPRFHSSAAISTPPHVHGRTLRLHCSTYFNASHGIIGPFTVASVLNPWRSAPNAQPRGATNGAHAIYLFALRLHASQFPTRSSSSHVSRRSSQPAPCTFHGPGALCSSRIRIPTGRPRRPCCQVLFSACCRSSSYRYRYPRASLLITGVLLTNNNSFLQKCF